MLKKIENWFTNKGARAIFVMGVFNKNIVKALTIKNATFQMQITQSNTILRYYFMVFYR